MYLDITTIYICEICQLCLLILIFICYCYYCCLHGQANNDGEAKQPIMPIDEPVVRKFSDNPKYMKNTQSLQVISKSKIKIIQDLGLGNFGIVYQGKVEGIFDDKEFTLAAIKSQKMQRAQCTLKRKIKPHLQSSKVGVHIRMSIIRHIWTMR